MDIDIEFIDTLLAKHPTVTAPTQLLQGGGGLDINGTVFTLAQLEAYCHQLRHVLAATGRPALGLAECMRRAKNPHTSRKQLLANWFAVPEATVVELDLAQLAALSAKIPVLPDDTFDGVQVALRDGTTAVMLFDVNESLIYSIEF